MKKLLCLVLVLALTLSLFAGCGPKTEIRETPLADVRVRKALWYAIDWDTIVETIWEDAVVVAPKSLVPAGEWQADGLTDYSYNPEKAKELLAEAEWDENFVIEAVYYTGNLLDTITAVKSYWAQVGVKMEFKLLAEPVTPQLWTPPADRVNGPSAVAWDIAFAGTNALMLNELFGRYSSTAANNSTIPKDEKMDALIATMDKAITAEQQKKAYDDLQIYLNETVYSMPMFFIPSWIVTSDKLDMKGNKPGNDQFAYEKNVQDWVIDRADKTLYTNTGAVSSLEHIATNPGLFWHQEIVFDRLLNAASSLAPTDGLLAEKFEILDDGATFKFTLREGVKWHDGEPLTGEDVKWTFEYLPTVTGANSLLTGLMANIDTVTVDGNDVTFKFKSAQPSALTVFSQWGILPKHLLKDIAPTNFVNDLFWQNPIGTGPFKVKEVRLGEHTILERNKDYFLKGTGNIETIFMYPSSDAGDLNLVTNMKAGKIDYAFVKDASQIKQLKGTPGVTIETVQVTFPRYAFFNMYPREVAIR